MVYYGPRGLAPAPNRLFRNEGDGTFVDVTAESGLDGKASYSFQVLAFDVEGDGDLDVFVVNDSRPNRLWLSDGTGRFEEGGLASGLAVSEAGRSQAGMGAALGDADGDGDFDVYVTNFSDDYHTLYRADGGGWFTDATRALGLAGPTFASLGWACGFLDADQDGDLDLFAANGHVYPQVDDHPFGTTYRQRNQLLENRGGRFEDVTASAGTGLAVLASSRGAAVGDLDADGDLDIVVSNLDETPTLLRNDGATGHWARVSLRGRAPNRDAIGATVRLEGAGRRQVRMRLAGSGFLGSEDPILHFGLGAAERVARLEVTWPDGEVTRYDDLPADRLLVVDEAEGRVHVAPPREAVLAGVADRAEPR
jgi:hypothetical protein